MKKIILKFLLAACCIPFLTGCNDGLVAVSGQVNYDQQPVENGTIQFTTMEPGGSVWQGLVENGRYTLRVEPGEKRVSICGLRMEPVPKEKQKPDLMGRVITEIQTQYLPSVYNDQTTLTATVEAGQKKIDFDLKAAESAPDPRVKR